MIYDITETKKIYVSGFSKYLNSALEYWGNGLSSKKKEKEKEKEERRGDNSNSIESLLDCFKDYPSSPSYDNSTIFSIGCFGFSDETIDKNLDMLKEFNEDLKACNSNLFFIRGEMDDKKFFNGDTRISFSNIIFLEDYSVIKTSVGNLLCIGGYTPVDFEYKIEKEGYLKHFNPHIRLFNSSCGISDYNSFKNVLEEEKIEIHAVLSYASLVDKGFLKTWIEKNESKKDCGFFKEQKELGGIEKSIINSNFLAWIYGFPTNSSCLSHKNYLSKWVRERQMMNLIEIISYEIAKKEAKKKPRKPRKYEFATFKEPTATYHWDLDDGYDLRFRNEPLEGVRGELGRAEDLRDGRIERLFDRQPQANQLVEEEQVFEEPMF